VLTLSLDRRRHISGVAVAGDLAYVAFGNDGLVILRYDEPVRLYLPLMLSEY
jgi:hypothetical protein